MITICLLACLMAIVIGRQVQIPKSIEFKPARPSTKEVMTAVSYSKHGGSDVLSFDDQYPMPIPNDNQILVQVKASAINPVDFKYRRNLTPNIVTPKPKIPGYDIAGVVVKVGKNVVNFSIGDRVAAMMPILGTRWGAAAYYAAVEESFACKIGEFTDFSSAASLPLVSLTFLQAMSKVKDPTGKKILIHAGAGGCGTFAIQYAKYVLNMHVATTASKPKEDFVKALGADVVIDYRTQDFSQIIKDYDVVFDTMSFSYEEATLNRSARVLKPSGHYLCVLSSDWKSGGGRERSNGLLTLRNLVKHKIINALRPGWIPHYDLVAVQPNGKQLLEVFNLLEEGRIRSVIDKTFPLSNAADAYDYVEQGHATGKVILQH